MFDKLEMRSQIKMDLKAVEGMYLPSQTVRMASSIYKRTLYVLDSNRVVMFFIETDPIWPDIAPTKITANPARWASFDDFMASLSIFCDPRLLEITRIDHAVDIEMPIEHIYQGMRIKHKKQNSIYKENCSIRGPFLTGFYLGVKPEFYCIYDKAYQLTVRQKLIKNKELERGILSRIELRQFKRKVKYKQLNELINYLSDPPFTNIEFFEAKDNSRKSEALKILMNEDGLQRAVAQLNRHHNFRRNNKKYLTEIDFESTIRILYEENLRRFFKVVQ
jgi:hypothetical protein